MDEVDSSASLDVYSANQLFVFQYNGDPGIKEKLKKGYRAGDKTFKEFPPRQKAASFTIDQVMEQLTP